MKKFLLFLFFPLIGYSQMYGTYIEKLIAEKYGKKPWYQIEEISSIKRTIKDDFGSTADLVVTYVDLDGNRMILREETKSFTGYLIKNINYDYTPSGGMFISGLTRYRFGNTYIEKDEDGEEWEYIEHYADGIWEDRSLPSGLRNGNWQRQAKDPNSSWYISPKIKNATPILCYRSVFIAGHFIEQLVKERESGYGCGMRSYPNNQKFVNEKDLKAMVKVFLQDLISTNGSNGNFSSGGFWVFNFNNSLFLNYLITETDSIIDAIFEPLEKDILGVSLGIFDNNKIVLKIDPQKWERATSLQRWYTIYHELGHDVLNLRHGEGGDMMFNFSIDSNYTWEDFFEDRDYMFKYFFDNFNEEKFTSSPKTSYDEIITRDEAVKRLKDAKEMLDMGILTKDEYDSLSKKLKPIIIGN